MDAMSVAVAPHLHLQHLHIALRSCAAGIVRMVLRRMLMAAMFVIVLRKLAVLILCVHCAARMATQKIVMAVIHADVLIAKENHGVKKRFVPLFFVSMVTQSTREDVRHVNVLHQLMLVKQNHAEISACMASNETTMAV
jgi:hypothetical protein